MEIDVLMGGQKFLEKFRPTIWIENHLKFPNKLNEYLLKKNITFIGLLHVILTQKIIFQIFIIFIKITQ